MKFHYSTSNKIVQSLQTHIQLFIFSCLIRSGQTVEMGPLIPKWSNRCFGFPAFVTNLYAMSVQGRAAGTNLLWKIIFIYSTRSKLFQEEVWKQFEVEQKCICDYLEQRLTIKQTKQSWQLQLLIPPKLKHKTMWFIMSWKKRNLETGAQHANPDYLFFWDTLCVQRTRSSCCQFISWRRKWTPGQMLRIKELVRVPAGTCWGFLWRLTAKCNVPC